MTDKTLARQNDCSNRREEALTWFGFFSMSLLTSAATNGGGGFFAACREFRGDLQPRKRGPNPFVNAPVTLLGLERMPFVIRREHEAVGPIRVVRHKAATGGTADEGSQQGCALDLGKFLEITERRRRFVPAVKAQHRAAQTRRSLQQRLIQRHVERRVAGAGIEKQKRTFNIQHRTLNLQRQRATRALGR